MATTEAATEGNDSTRDEQVEKGQAEDEQAEVSPQTSRQADDQVVDDESVRHQQQECKIRQLQAGLQQAKSTIARWEMVNNKLMARLQQQQQ